MTNKVAVSFEFFPATDDAMGQQLWGAIGRLAPLQPKFVSVTYGADGSTRTRTHDCVVRLLRETDLCVAPHLTCVGASREEVLGIAQETSEVNSPFVVNGGAFTFTDTSDTTYPIPINTM